MPDAGQARRRLSVIQAQKIDVNVTQFGLCGKFGITGKKGGLSSTNKLIKRSKAGAESQQKQVILVT